MFSVKYTKPITPLNRQLTIHFKKQKRRGSLFLRAYPRIQAFALPHRKDKQRKPAHAE